MGKRRTNSKSLQSLHKQTFFALAKSIDSPHSLALWLCLKYDDHASFLGLELRPENYGDAALARFLGRSGVSPQAFAYDLGITEYLSKYKGHTLQSNPKKQALLRFKTAEMRCKDVNRRLLPLLTSKSDRFEAIISIAQRKVSEVLGLRRNLTYHGGWGPGATFSIKADVAWDIKILEKRISVTPGLLPLAQRVIGADIHWCRARGINADAPCSLLPGEFKLVPGNRITTVPKNAETDRTIAIEPTANIFLQKSVGMHIRRRLKKVFGIDLDSQEPNQRAAGFLANATIDLKAASDTISQRVVQLLLPDEWYFLLDVLRSSNYYLDKAWHRYEKWSSMGNGYTFELETMLFACICFAVQSIGSSSRPWLRVYGDDIIVPVSCADQTIEALEFFGFETNRKKTHYKSLYRESCGSHYYDGFLVTPIYQKEIPDNVEELYHMANRIRHFACRLGDYCFSDSVCQAGWRTVVSHILTKHKRHFDYTPYSPGLDPNEDPLGGSLWCSLEDLESLDLPLYRYGSIRRIRRFVPKSRRYDHAAGLSYVLLTSICLTSSSRKQAASLSTESKETVSIRGRGRWFTRRTRVYRSFRSNTWL